MRELIEKYKKLNFEQERILKEKENIRIEFLKSAKFKEGDCVVWNVTNYSGKITGEKKHGIIRSIFPCAKYSDELSIVYRVGKIKKNGNIHGNQDVDYSVIPESELEKNQKQ
jgi:hypothetical protein